MKSLKISAFRVAGNLIALAGLAVLASCGSSGSSPQPQPSTTTSVSVGLSPTSLVGPGSVNGTVTISPAAPSGGATVGLQVTAGSGTLSATQVSIAQGATQAAFTLTVNPVTTTTNVEVTATYGSTTGRGSVAVSPPEPITANFVVTPDAGTGANPPLQCAVTNSNDTNFPNLLQCTFDGSSSLPATGITNYRWTLPGLTSPINQAGAQLARPKVGCGAGLNTVNVQLPVTLVVTAPGGTSSPKTQMVLFTKAGPC